MKWKPIEEFDKSKDDWFLGWDPDSVEKNKCREIRWCCYFKMFLDRAGCDRQPTHFMPLPEGPNEN